MAIYTKVDNIWKPVNITPGGNQEGTDYGWGFNVGVYFDSEINNQVYLIVAPISGGESTKTWKTTADATNFGTFAPQNTVNGIKNCIPLEKNTLHPAINWSRSLTLGGYSDWYLPAKDELHFIYTNKSILTAPYAFAATLYWSSTESSSTSYAWYENMSTGGQSHATKTGSCQVRAVRRLTL